MKYPDLPQLSDRLKWARNRAELRQDDLGKLVGTTRHAIQKIEDGITRRPRNMEKLARVLDVSPAWLQFNNADLDELSKAGVKLALAWETLPDELKTALQHAIHSAASKE